MIITVSGTPGAGKTTICRMLAEKLKMKHYYMGGIRRQVAKEKGMTIEEFNKLGEKDPSTDKIVDDYLIKLGKTEDNFIAEGRTAFHFIPNSIKIFFDVDPVVGAERIRKDLTEKGLANQRNETAGKTVQEQAALTKQRMESDNARYRKYYNIDVYDEENYDFVIDTTDLKIEQVEQKVLDFLQSQ
ncbi:cytidylate kinase family protein [Candidatus Woesearchaeota archaeon]|nr:cytidylate kinase family protein [Candidatus Woesearchaeota archaeon]